MAKPRGPRSYGSRPRRPRANFYRPTTMTLATLDMMARNGYRPNDRLEPGSRSYIHDMTSPFYSWLLPGWLAEERVVANGRIYKYYYDPTGYQYRAKNEVLDNWEYSGLIVLDA